MKHKREAHEAIAHLITLALQGRTRIPPAMRRDETNRLEVLLSAAAAARIYMRLQKHENTKMQKKRPALRRTTVLYTPFSPAPMFKMVELIQYRSVPNFKERFD